MPTAPRLRTLKSATPKQGGWVSLGHHATPPSAEGLLKAFGREKNIPGMVRLVKDVLPVGKWTMGYKPDGSSDVWDVTPETIKKIASEYMRGQQLGYAANLIKTHGNPDGTVHPDDILCAIDAVRVVNGTLWFSIYADAATAKYLSNPARKVSIGVLEPFEDGAGNQYVAQVVHIGVVDMPVVSSQGPFRALSTPSKGRRLMAGSTPVTPSGPQVQEFVQSLVDMLAPDEGLTVPELSEDWWNELQTFRGIVEGMYGKEEEATAESTAQPMTEDSIAATLMGGRRPKPGARTRHASKGPRRLSDAQMEQAIRSRGGVPCWTPAQRYAHYQKQRK